jgi:hypothetical protein
MARLSTGQSYGEASRASAAQLLGGIPTDASGGALAQGSINAPSLQPRATPVDTFQRVGAPTLGGPPKLFAPPDLPNPGQDLANLSKALGGFSSTLQNFGETWLANKKEEDKRQEAATGALVGQASRFGPARGIADLAANLEKAAALGNPDAARMLQVVREKQNSSVGKYWLERSVEQNAIQNAALSLPDLIANTSVIKKADGTNVDIKTLSPEDPTYLEYESDLLFAGGQMSPQGYAKNQGVIIQAQLQARQVQRKRYNTNQAIRLTEQITYNQQAGAQEYVANIVNGMSPDEAREIATRKIQSDIEAINYLPLTEEQKADLRDKYPERFMTQALAAVKQRGAYISVNILLRPLGGVMTGPIDQRVKADGTPNESLRLVNTLGGPALYDQLAAKANASLIQDNTQQSQMAGIQEQQAYDTRLAAALPEGRRSDPAAIKAFFQAERNRAAVEPDGIKRAAMFSQLDASERQFTETFVKPVQEQRALWYTQQLANTVGDEAARNRLTAQLQADLDAGRITSATAISIQTTLSAQGSKEVRTYDKDINKRIDDKTKDWELYIGSPNSYGDSTVTSFESQALYKFRDDARRRSHEVVYQAIKDGKDPVQALNQLWANSNFGLRKREDVGGTQAPTYDNTTELIRKNTGNWSRGTIAPREANQLRSSAKVRPLMKLESWDRDVTALLNGNASQNFRTLMKVLTTGTGGQKPSEVILNQFKLLGIDVPENERQKIQALDGQDISRATPARRASPQQNNALAGIQIVAGALGNLLVPPAAAAPTVAATMRPVVAARTQSTVTPQARVDGYMKRLAYIETRIRNIPNAKGSAGRGYFQAFPPFAKEAIAASGGIDPRDPDYNRSAKASAAWIRTYNKKAYAAIQAGRYDEADRLLRNTWPSLPGGSQAQKPEVQKAARKYLR